MSSYGMKRPPAESESVCKRPGDHYCFQLFQLPAHYSIISIIDSISSKADHQFIIIHFSALLSEIRGGSGVL